MNNNKHVAAWLRRIRQQVRAGTSHQADKATRFQQYTGYHNLINPLWCLYGFRIAVALLSIIGLLMVFSSSSVAMISANNLAWGQGINQTVYCVIGVIGYLVASRAVNEQLYRRGAMMAFLLAFFVQMLTIVPGIRHEVNGNAGWIRIGPITMQPAELTKLALCIWLPLLLIDAGNKFKRTHEIKSYLRVGACLALMAGSIMIGHDLGTLMIIFFIVLAVAFVSDLPRTYFYSLILSVVVLVIGLVLVSKNRMRRIFAVFNGCSGEDARGVCFQSIHANYALSSGGLAGVGIGNSREKWNYLPYAHNDFIFAIIGEEMGFLGAALVVLLYLIIGWCLLATAMQLRQRFSAFVLIAIASWLVMQGFINILVVVRVLPVLGVPMPFVSAGGSSLVMCLTAAGVADCIMRANVQAQSLNMGVHK